jgi:hypothetical protein
LQRLVVQNAVGSLENLPNLASWPNLNYDHITQSKIPSHSSAPMTKLADAITLGAHHEIRKYLSEIVETGCFVAYMVSRKTKQKFTKLP